MKENCEFCKNEFNHTVIKDYENWQLQLFMNQYYLGRCLIKLKDHKIDITELNQDERSELFEIVLPELKDSIDNLFNPSLYNHATLGNDCRHFHLHFIPRYQSERKFNGKRFVDENYNTHYKPYPAEFKVSNTTFEKLKEKIGEEIKWSN